MPHSNNVKPNNFNVERLIYSLNGFSIAWGVWQDDVYRLGMRWDGEGTDQGYPKAFGNPMWFMLPAELSLHMMQALGVDIQAVTGVERRNSEST